MATPWGRIRQGFMAGKSYTELAEKYHLKVKTIQNRASKEGWVKEKGKIAEEVGEKIHARVVRARVEQLEKLIEANEKLMDGLLEMAGMIQDKPMVNLFDKTGSLRNAESFAKAIQTAVATQRDLYRLPNLEQEMKKKAEAQRKREVKEKLAIEREKLDMEKSKAAAGQSIDSEVWQLTEPEGEELDG